MASNNNNQGNGRIWADNSDRKFDINPLVARVSRQQNEGAGAPTAKQLWTQICRETAASGQRFVSRLMGRAKS